VIAAAPAEAAGAVRRATLLVMLAACCFGSISILTAVAAAGGSSLYNTMAWRYVLGSALLALVAGPRAVLAVPARDARRLAVLGGVGQALVSFLGLLPLTRYGVPAATLGFLFYTFPAWVALFATVRGSERVSAGRAGALAVSLLGIVFLVGDPRAAALSRPGVAVALLAAVVYALYIPLLGRLRGTLPAAAASVYVTGGAGAIYVAGAGATGTLTALMAPAAWGAVVALAVVAIVVAFIVFLRGLAVLGPVRTAIVSTAEPFFTAALAAVVLAEPLTLRTGLGGVLIAAAVVLLQRTGRVERAP
jgi:drug/metabolite transporter (DMT)-like permease